MKYYLGLLGLIALWSSCDHQVTGLRLVTREDDDDSLVQVESDKANITQQP